MKGTEIGHAAFIKGVRIFGEHHIAIVRSGGSSNSRAVAPNQLLFLGGRTINLFLFKHLHLQKRGEINPL